MEQDEKKIRIRKRSRKTTMVQDAIVVFFRMSRERQGNATFGQYHKVNTSNLIYSI